MRSSRKYSKLTREVFEEYAEAFDDLIRKDGSKTLLFATANDMQVAFGKKEESPSRRPDMPG